MARKKPHAATLRAQLLAALAALDFAETQPPDSHERRAALRHAMSAVNQANQTTDDVCAESDAYYSDHPVNHLVVGRAAYVKAEWAHAELLDKWDAWAEKAIAKTRRLA